TRFDCDWSSDVCSSDLLRADRASDANGRSLPGLEISLGGQLVVSGGDHPSGDAELCGERAARRQAGAGWETAVADRVAQGAFKLLVQRPLASTIEFDQQINWPFHIGHKLELYAGPDAAYGLRHERDHCHWRRSRGSDRGYYVRRK